jgi:hypothetical protein
MNIARPDRAAVNKIFGTELPKTSSDERDLDSSAGGGERDRWLLDNVPPHNV